MFRRPAITAALGLATGAIAITLGAGPAAATGTSFGAQWSMSDPSVMKDDTLYKNDGKTTDITSAGGGGYSFNGTTSKVVVPNKDSLNPGTSDFSYSVTMQTSRVPPSGTDYDLIRKGVSSTAGGEYKLEIVYSNGIGKALCLVKDNLKVSATIRGTTNVTDGRVHTLTCEKTSAGVTLRVDSLTPRTKAASLGSVSNSSALTISAKTPTITGVSGDFYSGTMLGARLSLI
jgi:hypothetical protein